MSEENLRQENYFLKEMIRTFYQVEINTLYNRILTAIEKLEYYNSGEALYYVPIPDIIDILKGSE